MKWNHLEDHYFTVVGNIDNILSKRELVSYFELFRRYRKGVSIFLVGRPGSGKTTLVSKLCRDWGVRRNILRGARMVLFIPVHMLVETNINDLYDILSIFYPDASRVVNDLESTEGEGACFILDGLDEYPSKDSYTVINKLLHKINLPASMTIVTSCLVGYNSVRQYSEIIQVVGFTDSDIFEYIRHFPSETDSFCSEVKSYLLEHPYVLNMCYLPMHIAMLCFLAKYIPLFEHGHTSTTKLYETLTTLILLRYIRKHNNSVLLSSFKDLQGENKLNFDNICKLAFQMMIDDKDIMYENEFQAFSGQTLSNNYLDLVVVEAIPEMFGFKNAYSFSHKCLQEYLAAIHLAMLSHDKQLAIIRKSNCEMGKFFERNIALIKTIMTSTGINTLVKVQCAYESQQKVVCDAVLNFGESDTFSFMDSYLGHTEFMAISYVMSESQYPVSRLLFEKCSVDEKGIRIFVENLNSSTLRAIIYLGCYNCAFPQPESLLEKLPLIEIIDFKETELINADLSYSAKVHTLYLVSCKLNIHSLDTLISGLQNNRSLQVLNLDSNNIGSNSGGVGLLVKGLKNCAMLQTLNLECNNIGVDGTLALSTGMKCWKYLHTLNLASNNISPDAVASLADGLQSCLKLHTLDLDSNYIGSDGVRVLVQGLINCTNLQVLNLNSNNIGSDSVSFLAHALKRFDKLYSLHLKRNNIGLLGAALLSDSLNRCGVLDLADQSTCYEIDKYVGIEKFNTNYYGKPVECEWKEYGFKLLFEANGLSGHTHCSFCVTAISGGKLVFPNNTECVSGIFQVVCSHHQIDIPVKIQIQHCAAEHHINDLMFVCFSKKLGSYKFHCLEGGHFTRMHGEIQVSKYSSFAIVALHKKQGITKSYSVSVSYSKNAVKEYHDNYYCQNWGMYISFVKNCSIFQRCMDTYYNEHKEIEKHGNIQNVTLQEDHKKIELELSSSGETEIQNGWFLIHQSPSIMKSDIDDYLHGYPPLIVVKLQLRPRKNAIRLQYPLKLKGINEPYNIEISKQLPHGKSSHLFFSFFIFVIQVSLII